MFEYDPDLEDYEYLQQLYCDAPYVEGGEVSDKAGFLPVWESPW